MGGSSGKASPTRARNSGEPKARCSCMHASPGSQKGAQLSSRINSKSCENATRLEVWHFTTLLLSHDM
eukprot:4293794-Amphidinium_carterae.1